MASRMGGTVAIGAHPVVGGRWARLLFEIIGRGVESDSSSIIAKGNARSQELRGLGLLRAG